MNLICQKASIKRRDTRIANIFYSFSRHRPIEVCVYEGMLYFLGATLRPTNLSEYDPVKGEEIKVRGYMDTIFAFNLETNEFEWNGVETLPDPRGKGYEEMFPRDRMLHQFHVREESKN